MRILIVEDELKVGRSLKKGLEQEGFAVDLAVDFNDGFGMARTEDYDLWIVDRMLPGGEGLDIVRKMREKGKAERKDTPVIMLTAKGQITDRVEGLHSGADDYLVKPFAFEELLARIHTLLRRPKSLLPNKIKLNELVVDTVEKKVSVKGEPVDLSRTEFSLLEYLVRNKEKTLSKESIIAHVWDYDADILPNTVEVYIGYLRSKIEKPLGKKIIHTRRGFGYEVR